MRKQYSGPDSRRYKWTLKLKGWPTWKCDIWWQRCSVESFVSFEENANLNLVNPAPSESKKSIPMANWEQISYSSLGGDGKGMFCFWNGSFIFHIIAQIIIISEDLANKGSRLKNCILSLSSQWF